MRNALSPEDLKKIIDKCALDAKTLVNKLNQPECLKLGDLYTHGSGRTVKRKHAIPKDWLSNNGTEITGLYLFGEEVENGQIIPLYTGISRTVFRRLRQHGWGKSKSEASFAYRLSNRNIDGLPAMQSKIKQLRVVVLPIKDDDELYISEFVVAKLLNTAHNEFRTH